MLHQLSLPRTALDFDKTEISNGPLESDHFDQEVISCLLKGRGPDSTGGNGGEIGGRSQCGEDFLGGHAMVVASGVCGINIFPRCNAKHLAMITRARQTPTQSRREKMPIGLFRISGTRGEAYRRIFIGGFMWGVVGSKGLLRQGIDIVIAEELRGRNLECFIHPQILYEA